MVELEQRYMEMLAAQEGAPGAQTKPASDDVKGALALMRVPAYSKYETIKIVAQVQEKTLPPPNTPKEEAYTKAVESILQDGVQKLEGFPAWKAHFARMMHREMGAWVMAGDDPTWVHTDAEEGSPRRCSRPDK